MDGKRGKRSSLKQSGSHVGSQTGSRQSSVYSSGRLRSSLSFMGSRTSLTSSSKRSLMSESQRLQKQSAQIFDENGEDVTPQSLLTADMTKKPCLFLNDTSSLNDSAVQQSGVLSSGSFSQPFSMSVLAGTSVTEGSLTSMSMVGLSLGQQQSEHVNQTVESDLAEALHREGKEGERSREDPDDEVAITLSETPTFTLLHIPGTVGEEEEDREAIQKANHTYQELLKTRPGNDRYSVKGMQTIDNAKKTKHSQTEPTRTTERGVAVSTADMYDTYNTTEDTIGVEDSVDLSNQAHSRLAGQQHPPHPPTAPGPTEHTLLPGESQFVGSVFSGSVFPGNNNLPGKPRGIPNQETPIDPTQPNDHPILKSQTLRDSLNIVEKAIIMNRTQQRQAVYRNLPILKDPDHPTTALDSFQIQKPHLSRLWVFSCPLTQCRQVTALALNPRNKDVIAVGYGAFTDREQGQGLICCWSLKNSEFPDRIFHAPSGVTSLSFSFLYPNLLAAGLYNGTLALYNVRNTSHESVMDSRDALHHHSAAVWQVSWVVREHLIGEDAQRETLISTSVDGRVLQWSIRKGFESTLLMMLKRTHLPKPHPGKKFNKAAAHRGGPSKSAAGQARSGGQGEAIISQHAPGLGFDFWPKDPNIYLACTEEGLIHKCSCSYNERVLETYKGHTGPVYKVRWSPCASDVFLSCSSDWTVKLWHHNCPTPLHSFHTLQRAIHDVVWSPFHCSMFGCVSDSRVDVWNIEHSMLVPIVTHKPFSGSAQTCLSFVQNAQALLVGEGSGEVFVYQLKNTPEPQHQADALVSIVQSLMAEVT